VQHYDAGVEPNWYTLPDFLIEHFPELREEIEEEYYFYLDGCANPFPHFFLSSFIVPLLIGRPSVPDERRRRAGEVLELVLKASDEDLAEAALLEVLDNLLSAPELLTEAWPWLGPIARESVEALRRG
jgi:hypothetical protein